jgi:hydroxylysine kinase
MFSEGKPDLSPQVLADIAAAHFDVRGNITSLGSERDQNVSIVSRSDAYVLKVASLADDLPMLELQNTIMQTAARCQFLPPVPTIVPSRRNRFIEVVEVSQQRYAVRLLTLLPGVAAARVPGRPELWADVGRAAAHLTNALLPVRSDLSRPLLWDIANALRAREFLPHIAADEERGLLASVLDEAEEHTLPQLAQRPRQWIHNDLNLNNLLVDPRAPTHVSGIIDFGDMVAAPRVLELAIAAAHQCGREQDPLPAVTAVTRAYHGVARLDEADLELIPQLVSLRLAMAVLIRHARAVTASSQLDPADYAGLIRAVRALRHAGPHFLSASIRSTKEKA